MIEYYNKHVRDIVRPAIEHFDAAVKTEDVRVIVDAWSRLCRRLDAPGSSFARYRAMQSRSWCREPFATSTASRCGAWACHVPGHLKLLTHALGATLGG